MRPNRISLLQHNLNWFYRIFRYIKRRILQTFFWLMLAASLFGGLIALGIAKAL